jgi:sugar lactone lactonase YvrE
MGRNRSTDGSSGWTERRGFFVSLIVILFTIAGPVLAEPTAEPIFLSRGFGGSDGFDRPMDVAFDPDQELCYVADTGRHRVVVLDARGFPVFRFDHFVGRGELGEPKSICVDRRGRILLTDATVPYVDVLTSRGRSIARVLPPKGFDRFDALALGPGDTVVATLAGPRKAIALIPPALEPVEVIELELLDGERPFLVSVAATQDGRFVVADPGASRFIQIFDRKGRLLRSFGLHDTGEGNFSFPSDLAVTDEGVLWVVDQIRQTVSAFTLEGEFLWSFGGRGAQAGAFDYPVALATDRRDRLFVLERVGKRLQGFRLSGLGIADREALNVSRASRKGGE